MRTVGGNRERRIQPERQAVAAGNPHAHDSGTVMDGTSNEKALVYLDACGGNDAQERGVEYRAPKRPPEYTVAVAADHPDAGLAGDDHAGHRHSAIRHRANSQPAENAERARVERIATELLAGKPRPIDQAHPRARPREHQRRNRPRRTRATDQNVRHRAPARTPSNPFEPFEPFEPLEPLEPLEPSNLWNPWNPYPPALPTTTALFFDPNPRQLHNAASTVAWRPQFGMKSRSQSGSDFS